MEVSTEANFVDDDSDSTLQSQAGSTDLFSQPTQQQKGSLSEFALSMPWVLEGHNSVANNGGLPREKTAEEIFGLTEHFQSLSFFQQFDVDERARLASKITFTTLHRSQTMSFEGSMQSSLFVILDGEVEVGEVRPRFSKGDTVGYRHKKAGNGSLTSSAAPVYMQQQSLSNADIVEKRRMNRRESNNSKTRMSKFTRRNSLSTALTKQLLVVARTQSVLLGEIPFQICEDIVGKKTNVVYAPIASSKILAEIEPNDRNDQECSVVIELLKTINYIAESSNDMKRILAKEFRIATVKRFDVLCSYNSTDAVDNCEWFIVPIKGCLALHSSRDLADVESDELEPLRTNRRKLIQKGESFPSENVYEVQKMRRKITTKQIIEAEGLTFSETTTKGIDGKERIVSKYCIAGHSLESEILFMPLSKMDEIMNPNEEFCFNVEDCRRLAKIPPIDRELNDVQKLLTYLKPHVFFQQLTQDACLQFARAMRIGFLDEGADLVCEGECLSSFYILLSGACNLHHGKWNPKSEVVSSMESGDMVGVQLFLKGRKSPFTIRVSEPSEFLVLSGSVYGEIMGNNNSLANLRQNCRFERNRYEQNFDDLVSKDSTFAIFRNSPDSFRRNLRKYIQFKHIDQHVALGNSEGLSFLIVDGSVSLHKHKDGRREGCDSFALVTENDRGRNMAHFGLVDCDVQDSKTRKWWKSNWVYEAECVLGKGSFVGDLSALERGRRGGGGGNGEGEGEGAGGENGTISFGGYAAFTREKCFVCEVDVQKLARDIRKRNHSENVSLFGSSIDAATSQMFQVQRHLKNSHNDISGIDVEVIQGMFRLNPLTEGLACGIMMRLAKCSVVQVVREGEEVLWQGSDEGEQFGIVIEGTLQIKVKNEAPRLSEGGGMVVDGGGKEICVGFLTSSDWFGDDAIKDGERKGSKKETANYSLIANEDTTVLTISQLEFVKACERFEEARNVRVRFAESLQRTQNQADGMIKEGEEEEEEEEEAGEIEEPKSLFVTQLRSSSGKEEKIVFQGTTQTHTPVRQNLLAQAIGYSPIRNKKTTIAQPETDDMAVTLGVGGGKNVDIAPIKLMTSSHVKNHSSGGKTPLARMYLDSYIKPGRSYVAAGGGSSSSGASYGNICSMSSFSTNRTSSKAFSRSPSKAFSEFGDGPGGSGGQLVFHRCTLPGLRRRSTPAYVRLMQEEVESRKHF